MEKITRHEGKYYYGGTLCHDANEAYKLFRNDYHKVLGRQVYKRLDRCARRVERTHGIGTIYAWDCYPDGKEFWDMERAGYYVLGIVGFSYWYKLGSWDFPKISDDEKFDRWLTWALSFGSHGLVMRRVKEGKQGRSSERYKKEHDAKKKHNNNIR